MNIDYFVDGEALTHTKLNVLVDAIKLLQERLDEETRNITDADAVVNMTTLDAPTYFKCATDLTSLAITMKDMAPEVTIYFKVASSVTTKLPITVTGTAKVIGDPLDFEALPGLTYELSIRNGIMTLGDVNDLT